MRVYPQGEVNEDLCFNLRNVSFSLVAKVSHCPPGECTIKYKCVQTGLHRTFGWWVGGGDAASPLLRPRDIVAALCGEHQSSGLGCFPEPLSVHQLKDHPLPAIFTNISASEI